MTQQKVPLKLLVEPDEYLCTWLLPDTKGVMTECAGDINLRVGRPPTGSVHGNLPIQWTANGAGAVAARFPQEVRLQHLRARLANGYEVNLADASIDYWAPDRGHVSAASATVGATNGLVGFGGKPRRKEERTESESSVPSYLFISTQVGALDAIAGTPPLTKWEYPKFDEGRHLEGNWVATGNPNSSQEWSDDDATVRLEYDANVSIANPYAFRFAASPVVRIESRVPMTVREWADRWVTPLQRIASIATGNAEPLTYLAVHPTAVDKADPRPRPRHQVYGPGITQAPYQSDYASVQRSSAAVSLATDGVSLLDMFRRWHSLEEEHHPLIETYGAMLSAADEEHPRSRFLLLIQALEGLHGHETKVAYGERQQRHTEARESLMTTLCDANILSSEQLGFLKTNLGKYPRRSLAEALHNLLKSLPVDLTPALAECDLLAEHLQKANGSETSRVAHALNTVRNDLAHGNRGYDPYDLAEAGRVLERVVRAHALRLLGCPEVVLKRVCEQEP